MTGYRESCRDSTCCLIEQYWEQYQDKVITELVYNRYASAASEKIFKTVESQGNENYFKFQQGKIFRS